MCINNYGGFKKMTKFCKTRVPQDLEDKMESIQNDAAAIKAFGVEFGAGICKELMEFGCRVLHFYTLNLEKVVYGIMDEIHDGTTNLLDQAIEVDAASQMAVGSAWARVGDKVKCAHGEGIVMELKPDGAAVISMQVWNDTDEAKQPTVCLQKGEYEKIFA
jgi:methylenetetrahydrofolate reductase (NADPH)